MIKSIKILLSGPILLFWGVVLMYWSQPLFFTLGQKGRLGTLFLGFSLVMLATIRRVGRFRRRLNHAILFIAPCYFGMLLLLSYGQEHLSLTLQNVLFQIVCWALFIAGYYLAKVRCVDWEWEDSWLQLVACVAVIVVMFRFLDFVRVISFYGTERGFGESQLNPVGAAYVAMVLALAFLYRTVSSRHLLFKPIYLLIAVLCCLAVVSTGSRGAPLWGVISVLFLGVVIFRRRLIRINLKLFLKILLAFVVAVPVILYILQSNFAIGERFDILVKRFIKLFEVFQGGTGGKSVAARSYSWVFYLNTVPEWWFLGKRGYSGYPHNQWLEIVVRYGVLGIPMLLVSIFVLGRTLWFGLSAKYVVSQEWLFVCLLFLFAYLQSMTSLSLDANRILWLGLGYMMGYDYKRFGLGVVRENMNLEAQTL